MSNERQDIFSQENSKEALEYLWVKLQKNYSTIYLFQQTKNSLLPMIMVESLVNIGWLNTKQRWKYSSLIHTTHGRDEPMKIQTDFSDSLFRRKRISKILRKKNFNIIQNSSTIDQENDSDGLLHMKYFMNYLSNEKLHLTLELIINNHF